VGASKSKGIPDMRIENGKTTKISIHIPSLLAAEAFTVDNHEEEEEEQVEHQKQIEPSNLSNDKEVSTKVLEVRHPQYCPILQGFVLL
jgi:hypothetical protein